MNKRQYSLPSFKCYDDPFLKTKSNENLNSASKSTINSNNNNFDKAGVCNFNFELENYGYKD